MTPGRLHHRINWLVRRAHTTAGRFLVSLLAVISCWLGLSASHLSFRVNTLVVSSVWSYVMLALIWLRIARNGPRETRLRAASEDPGRLALHAIVLMTSLFSMVGVFLPLHESAFGQAKQQRALWISLCVIGTIGAWLLNHTSWTLRYAHLYYRDHGEGVGGLNFPSDGPPDDWDFAYFAFTIGMCFQVSDVTISDRRIRRAALVHALQSFGFNTTIVALTLNVAYSLLS